jgi:hypothetical protein
LPTAETLKTVGLRVLATSATRSETNDVCWQRFGSVELRPVELLEQFERELELVEERQAMDCMGIAG